MSILPPLLSERFENVRLFNDTKGYCQYICQDKNSGSLFSFYTYKFYSTLPQPLSHDELLFEAQKYTGLSSPFFSKIFDFGMEKDTLYTLEEYYQYTNLPDFCSQADLNEITRLMIQITYAFETLFQQNIHHNNLTPDFIHVLKDGSIKIKTFAVDLSALLQHFITQKNPFPSSFLYLSPDKSGFTTKTPNHLDNLYSLGIVFYEMLTSRNPFESDSIDSLIYKHLSWSPPDPSLYRCDIPPLLSGILQRLLKKQQNERYQSYSELIKDLNLCLKPLIHSNMPLSQSPIFISRDKELKKIQDFLSISPSFPAYIFLTGGAGVGKSALAQTFLARKNLPPENLLHFKCTVSTQNMPYLMLLNIFSDFFKTPGSVDLLKIPETQALLSVFPTLSRNLAADFHSTPLKLAPDTNPKPLINQILINFFRSILTKKKFILFFDDIQWADSDSLQFLLALPEIPDLKGLLIIFTSREPLLAGQQASRPGNLLELKLKNFDLEETKTYIRSFFPAKLKIDNTLYTAIHEASSGNPFRILEVIRLLAKHFRVQEPENTLFLHHRAFGLISGQKEIVNERLKSWPKEEKLVLKLLAAFGKTMEIKFLKQFFIGSSNAYFFKKLEVYPDNLSCDLVDTVLKKGIQEGILSVTTKENSDYLFFTHDITLTKIYDGIDLQKRKLLHEFIARIFGNYYDQAQEQFIYVLAYHYNKTDKTKRILQVNHRAYWKALDDCSPDNIIYYLKILLEKMDWTKENPKNIIELLGTLAINLQFVGKLQKSRAYLHKALNLCNDNNLINEKAEIYSRMGISYYYVNKIEQALKYFQHAFALSQEQDIQLKTKIPYYQIGTVFFYKGYFAKAKKLFDNALSLSPQDDFDYTLPIYCLNAFCCLAIGNFGQAAKIIRLVEDHIHQITNPILLSQVYHLASDYYSYSYQDAAKALDYSLKAFQLAEKTNYQLYQYLSYFSRMSALLANRGYNEVLQVAKKARNMAQNIKTTLALQQIAMYESEALLAKNEYEQTITVTQAILSQPQLLEDKLSHINLLRINSLASYALGKTDNAIENLKQALTIYEDTKFHYYGISVLFVLKKIYAWSGQNSQAKGYAEKISLLLKKHPGLKLLIKIHARYLKEIEIYTKNSKHRILSSRLTKEKLQKWLLIKNNRLISNLNDNDEILNAMLSNILKATGAERGAFILSAQKPLSFAASIGIDTKHKETILSLIEKKLPPAPLSTQTGPDFTSSLPAHVKSFLLLPAFYREAIHCYLYLDSSLLENLFQPEDWDVIQLFCTHAVMLMKDIEIPSLKQPLPPGPPLENFPLTVREKEILNLILQRFSNEEISNKLCISIHTTKNHISNIFEKTGVKTRKELFKLFQKY